MEIKQRRVAYCSRVARHTIRAGVTESYVPECPSRSSATAVVQRTHTVLLVISTFHITQACRHTHKVYSQKSSLKTFTCLLLHSALLTALSSDFFTRAGRMRSEFACSVMTSATWLTSYTAQLLLQELGVWALIQYMVIRLLLLIGCFICCFKSSIYRLDHQWKRELGIDCFLIWSYVLNQ